jgi:cyclophilin family peptidyl-prolyl cis-trans isomerase
MRELQTAQVRRNRLRRGVPVVAVIIVIAVVAIIITGSSGGGKKKVSTANATTTTQAAGTSTGLVAHTAPAVSSACDKPASGAKGSGAAPASGRAVSIVPAPAHVPFPNLNGSSPRYTKFSSAPPFCINVNDTYTATVTTDAGSFVIKLLPKDAPVSVNNFIFLAGYHYYDGIVFHRVIPNFMDQVGDPTATGDGGPGYTIPDEYPSSNSAYDTGAVAMANTGQPNTGGSQIFIVVPGGGSGLAATYSVFGQVTSGMTVVEKINAGGTTAGTPSVYHKITNITITQSA